MKTCLLISLCFIIGQYSATWAFEFSSKSNEGQITANTPLVVAVKAIDKNGTDWVHYNNPNRIDANVTVRVHYNHPRGVSAPSYEDFTLSVNALSEYETKTLYCGLGSKIRKIEVIKAVAK